MTSLNRIEIFLEVAKQQSFAGAAKTLGITGPAASKQIIALEDELGVKLLHRTTRLVTLTEEGAAYYERARLAMDELNEAACSLQDMKSTPQGALRITAPLVFGEHHLIPVLTSFAKEYPDIVMDISFNETPVDILAEGFDMAIRIGANEDSTLIARKLASCPICVVAAPAYLKKHGTPQTPDDLKSHRMILRAGPACAYEWRYQNEKGTISSVKLNSALKTNASDMILSSTLEGLGLAILPYFLVADLLKQGALREVLSTYKTHPLRDITALMPPNRYRSTKVKLLLEWIIAACNALPLEKKS